MKHKTFIWFLLPTFLAMLIFIFLPIISVVLQSVHTPHENVLITVENCDPLGCKKVTSIDHEATKSLNHSEPLGKFVGLDIYAQRNLRKILQKYNNETNATICLTSHYIKDITSLC